MLCRKRKNGGKIQKETKERFNVYNGSVRRKGDKGRINNDQEFSKTEKDQNTNLKSSVNSKQEKYK